MSELIIIDHNFDKYYERPVNVPIRLSKWQCMGEKTNLQTTLKNKVQTNDTKVLALIDTSDKLVLEKEQEINILDISNDWTQRYKKQFFIKTPVFFILIGLAV